MSYENLRTDFLASLTDSFPSEEVERILHVLDKISADYEFTYKAKDLIVASGVPEIVKMYIASLVVENKAKSTVDDYRRKLIRFFDCIRKPFDAVTTNDIRIYMWQYQQDCNLQKSSLDHVRSVLNAFFEWLVDQELLQRNPCRLIDPIKYNANKLPPLDVLELEYLRSACRSPREKALVDFLASSGCRISECAAVKLTDINWDDRSIVIRHGKGDKERTTYFNAEARVSLQTYLDSKKVQSPYLFSKSRAPYGKLTTRSLEEVIKEIYDRAAVRLGIHVTPHTFRRTMATHLADSGMPVEEIKELLGHARIDTTMRYISVSKKRIKASYDKYTS